MQEQRLKLIRSFIRVAAILLLATATGKILTGFGKMRVLEIPDPIFGLSFRTVMFLVGALELGIALYCLIGRKIKLQVALIAFLSTDFLLYRIGLVAVGWDRPCKCMGTLADMLHMTPEQADLIMKVILGFLLVGSYWAAYQIFKKGSPSENPAHQPPDLRNDLA